MKQYLDTILPELKNVTRLFSLPDEVWEGEQPRFAFAAEETDGRYTCRATGDGHEAVLTAEIPDDADERIRELHRKRAARRLVKQTAYDLCRKATGIHPPWGSLTGIRPTHLIYEAMSEGIAPEEAAVRVRERFDLTEEKAALLAQIAHVQGQLPPPDDKWMDVYIGIPFCTTRCTYCSFSSGEIGNGRLVEPYLTALFREMEMSASIIAESGRTLRAVYVGGGTPTSLNAQQLKRRLDHLMLLFP